MKTIFFIYNKTLIEQITCNLVLILVVVLKTSPMDQRLTRDPIEEDDR